MSITQIKKQLMGGNVTFIVYDIDEKVAEFLLEEVYQEGKKLEKIFNFFDPKSELSKLNKKRSLVVSKEFLEVINKALEFCDKTNGAYDISIGKQILQRKHGKEITKINCSYKNIEIKDNLINLKHEDVLIDLGSIAKGYIVDKLVAYMKEQEIKNGLVDGRGDIRVFGRKEKIDIQNPRNKDEMIYSISLKDSAIATSGDYSQYYGSYDKSHIIGSKELISVTVVASTLIEADVFASCIFLLNKKEREDLIKQNSQIKVFTVDKVLKHNLYNGFEKLRDNGKQ
nr:hypothetical protein [Nanoarchaeum sp.]